MIRARRGRGPSLAGALTVLVLLIAGCTQAEEPAAGGGGEGASEAGGADTEQVVRTPDAEASASGEGCTLETYAGGGVEAIELEGASIGFSQSEPEANPFRIAETQSIRDQAAEVGADLTVTNANADLSQQIADIEGMVAQGVQALIVAPLNSDGLEPAFNAAREAGIPVVTIDRKVTLQHCTDYLTFIGSDFYEQGRRAAEAMVEATGGEAQVAILLGSAGNNVTEQRNQGFLDYIEEEAPGLEVVAEQTGNFSREEGQQVMEQLIQANPGITAVYAHNDEMALGALVALRTAGKQPGQDVKVVSVDGTRNAVEAITKGDINAVIESNPRFGPLAFQTLEQFYAGEAIPEDIIIQDREYSEENAEADLDTAY